ncbi:MAG: recombination regulator RecX [Sulfuricellaceae bacterium]|nr:recombination regulator RecX [Sulfuricellaceae bacterium]
MDRKTIDLRQRALACLSRREYSRLELQRKLAPHAGEDDDLNALLDDLEARNWLSDSRYAEQIVHARGAKYGAQRIAYELREQGVDEAFVAAALAGLQDGELERAREVWGKKFGHPPRDAQEKAKQVRFLQSRGFAMDVIFQALRHELGETE